MSEVAIFQTLCLAFLAVGGRAKNRPELGEMAICTKPLARRTLPRVRRSAV